MAARAESRAQLVADPDGIADVNLGGQGDDPRYDQRADRPRAGGVWVH